MNVMVPIPDALAAHFGSEAELGRRVVEALVLEEYRAGRLTQTELAQLLGLTSGPALDGFFKAHGVDARASQRTSAERKATERGEADELIARFRAFAARHTLGGLDIKELISEGRR